MKLPLLIAALFTASFITCVNAMAADDTATTAPAPVISSTPPTVPLPPGMTPIFDGTTLNGWVEDPQYPYALSGRDITDLKSLAKKLTDKSDPISAYLAGQLPDVAQKALTSDDPDKDAKALTAALSKGLTAILEGGSSMYDAQRFQDAKLRPETQDLLQKNPTGQQLSWLNRLLLEDAYPAEIHQAVAKAGWEVKDGAITSTGAGRGVLSTTAEYGAYRIIFDMRHISAAPKKDHQPCVLVFCFAPTGGKRGLDALGGVQFQVPNGGHWDYRPGKNNGGKDVFTSPPTKTKYNNHDWSRVEILVDPATSTARMAVAQPVGSKAVENLDFKDAGAGHKGPFALQMHNDGLFDAYANISIEENPSNMDLITTK